MFNQPGSIGSQMPASEDTQLRRLRDVERFVTELGPSIAKSFQTTVDALTTQQAQLAGLLNDLQAQVDSAMSTAVNTGNVTATGFGHFGTDLTAGGPATIGGTLTANTGMRSTGVYNTLLTYGGAYSSQYVHVDGTMGYVPSSRQFKQDIMPTTLDPALLTALQLVTFRYIDAVENLGDDAETELGLIAEDVDALGLTWLVDYGIDGKPAGVKYERLALLMLPWAQSIEARVTALEARPTA